MSSVGGNSGHWDKGKIAIAAYQKQKQHKCNSICRSLRLDKDKKKTAESHSNQGLGSSSKHPGPLRIGFSS
jgi:hypothetical protein